MPANDRTLQITIVGTGAMACWFGACLARVSKVTLTGSWLDGIAAIRAAGIIVTDDGRQTAVPVAAVPWGDSPAPADLVIVLVKAWQTVAVAPRIESLLAPGGIALTLQNGSGNLEILGRRACLGVTHQGATLLGPGHVRPGGRGPTWIAGPEWISSLFRDAGMACLSAPAEQIDGLLWGKLAVNCGINALTAVLGIANGELLLRPDAMRLMERASRECAAVARARNIVLPFPDPAAKAREVAEQTAANRSSMLQDVLRGAPTECEAIYGAVVSWGKALDIPTPVNEVLLHLMRALEAGMRSPASTAL